MATAWVEGRGGSCLVAKEGSGWAEESSGLGFLLLEHININTESTEVIYAPSTFHCTLSILPRPLSAPPNGTAIHKDFLTGLTSPATAPPSLPRTA